jgi:hypothetical protein
MPTLGWFVQTGDKSRKKRFFFKKKNQKTFGFGAGFSRRMAGIWLGIRHRFNRWMWNPRSRDFVMSFPRLVMKDTAVLQEYHTAGPDSVSLLVTGVFNPATKCRRDPWRHRNAGDNSYSRGIHHDGLHVDR